MRAKPVTIAEYIEQMEERMRPVEHNCATCFKMPHCWLHEPDFVLEAMKSCWTPRPVPHYINNIKTTIQDEDSSAK